ncbi:chlorophyll synthase ChlG [Gloeobacter kilaueensis]|uniref:Bacteriochlorophyll/chlorophyll a synthase n=1 Tax=Gloeobacter kilaueensis (strain ATCC BAA-2537 / CCAP 1431/1 / ULC 316 / JS1) TaxID=1183438 RepID=U5QFN9_GLOK1|nr:chlorophyll synthase ChlG [Gloeobacter kilaueensis]AGY57751.1 bacteriochlorophyll/chlorophyll a synthase [Gloeobacter kilaueensis JS1]
MENTEKDTRRLRRLLGIRGAEASRERAPWQIRLQLMKPVTWIPLIWGVLCGTASAGQFNWLGRFQWNGEHCLAAFFCMILAGPLLAGYTQTLNEYYDRDLDAINEPYRPIPSGAIALGQVVVQIWVLLILGLAVALGLDLWAGAAFGARHTPFVLCGLTVFGALVAYIYSAPPLKLKQNGWLGSYALGASYIALPWWAGHALFGTLSPTLIALTLFYSFAGLGIAIVNDFKSIEGDRRLGLKSLPVIFGTQKAAWICVSMIDVFQIGVLAYLLVLHSWLYAAILTALVLPQIVFQKRFLADPVAGDVRYQASSQPFLVFGMLVTGLALGLGGV